MSEPTPITIEQVRAGDTVRLERHHDGEYVEMWKGRVLSVPNRTHVRLAVGDRFTDVANCVANPCKIFLIHRPPTRRAITLDDLKDWRAVPIGTRIEFEAKAGEAVKMTLMGRYQFARDWMLYPADGCGFHMSSIKEDTLFVIEESKS